MKLTEDIIVARMAESGFRPKTFDELCAAFRISQKEKKYFRKMIKQLRRRMAIIKQSDKRYRVVGEDDVVIGRVKKHAKGFGFLIPETPGHEDVHLSRSQLFSVMNGDRIKVLKSRGGRFPDDKQSLTGKVLEIIERTSTTIVGRLLVKGKKIFVIPQKTGSHFGGPDNIEIPFSQNHLKDHNHIVVCEVTAFPKKFLRAKGVVKKVLGKLGTHKVDFSIMIHQFNLRDVFPGKVLEEADRIKKQGLKYEKQNRKDLTHLPFMTIDGETAKDFDDAVYVEKQSGGGYRLFVAIADVSFFVTEGSELDKESFERGTSVYFPGGVVPMFPETLSNDLCSLNPNEDKMVFCCEMDFDSEGKRTRTDIYEAVIISQNRMTYTAVQAIVEKDKKTCKEYESIVPQIELMQKLKETLRAERLSRGCMDFDLPEPEIVLNNSGDITDILKRARVASNMIIEEFMIAANEAVAEFMSGRRRPFIYRVHEEPDAEKLFYFHELAHNLGYALKPQKKVHAKTYSTLLEKVKGKPEEHILNTALLRSMKMAKYTEDNIGHFGLASECYSHFTSPIRRYPDLIAHRLLKAELKRKGKKADMTDGGIEDQLRADSEHCSRTERNAEAAEREFVALKTAEYMVDKVGQEFVGFISGVTEFGFFVELADIYVEGLVPLKTLNDDYYQFVPNRYLIRGRRHGETFQLGQKVLVNLKRVDLDKRQIDFELLEA